METTTWGLGFCVLGFRVLGSLGLGLRAYKGLGVWNLGLGC